MVGLRHCGWLPWDDDPPVEANGMGNQSGGFFPPPARPAGVFCLVAGARGSDKRCDAGAPADIHCVKCRHCAGGSACGCCLDPDEIYPHVGRGAHWSSGPLWNGGAWDGDRGWGPLS